MILQNDELNPAYGNIPVNNGTYWFSRPRYLYNQVTNVTLTAAAAASMVNTTNALGNVLLPAGLMNIVGRSLRLKANGYITTGGTAGTLTFAIKLGATFIATTGTITPVVSQTTKTWSIDIISTCKTTNVAGGTGTIDTFGMLHMGVGVLANESAGFQNSSTVGTQVPGTPGAVDQTTALLYDVQYTPTQSLHTLVVTNLCLLLEF